MHSLTTERARTLLSRSEELLISIQINQAKTASQVLFIAKEGGYVQDICTANIDDRVRWLYALQNEPDYPLLLKIGREKKIPIIEAIKFSRDALLEQMLDAGLDINFQVKRTQCGPLEMIVRSSKPHLMRMLIEKYHANPNIKNPLWQTPIYAAVEIRNIDALTYLLEKGANVNALDSFGNTPLSLFLADKQLRLLDKEILDILLQHGADCNGQHIQTQLSPLHMILSNMFAPANVKVMAVEMLLEHRANPDLSDSKKRVPLHYICSDLCDIVQKSRCNIVSLLLKFGADPNLQDECYNTASHRAAQYDLAKVVELLMTNGANPKLRNVDGLLACDLDFTGKGMAMVLSEALTKWEELESEGKTKKEESESPNAEGKKLTFKEVSVHLQAASDRFRTSINRVEDAIAQLDIVKAPPKKNLESIDEDFDEVDAKLMNVFEDVNKNSDLTTSKESLEVLKLEFYKLKSYAYSFQNDYTKVVKELKLHRNCKADFEIPESPEDHVDRGKSSYFDESSKLPKPSIEEKTLAKACHITSTLLGHDWKMILRELQSDDLVVTEVIIKELESKYPGQLREQAYQALLHWKMKSGITVTYRDLIEAVSACSLGAIQQRLEEAFGSDKYTL